MTQQPSCWRGSYVGADAYPMYVEERLPAAASGKPPIVMVHGGGHCGLCYTNTPDLRTGWAPYFTAHGYPTYVIDWPGHGRSPMPSEFATMSTRVVVAAVLDLVGRLPRCVLMTHSMGGPIGWLVAEKAKQSVAAVLAIAPGPPANLQPELAEPPAPQVFPTQAMQFGAPEYQPEDRLVRFHRDSICRNWANSAHFPSEALDAYCRGIFPESARAINERYNFAGRGLFISGPDALSGIPIAVVTGDMDTRHPREADEAVACYLGADFLWLPDYGLHGHGHMMMIEQDNLRIADALLAWLGQHGL